MTVRTYHTSELNDFVAACDAVGGIGHPASLPLQQAFALRCDVRPDQSLDPFSDAYFGQMVALYRELAGRELNQDEGEMTPLDVPAHAAGVNPYNNPDVTLIARHARAVHACLLLANLPPAAAILDAGCGWGLSTEAMAFAGARVTALDINPLFVDLVRRRAARLGLPVTAVRAPFDAFDTADRFDLLFFYECLHHSLKPWETLARLGRFVKPDGRIVFAGEPINAIWWKDWGLRLDALSVYCIRKFGWWESGWSPEFLVRCFARAGFTLALHPHVGLENGHIGFACRQGREADVAPNLGQCEPVRATEAWYGQRLAERDAELAAARLQANQLRHEAEQREGQVAALRAAAAGLEQELAAVRASRSWRVTAPLRAAFGALGLSRR